MQGREADVVEFGLGTRTAWDVVTPIELVVVSVIHYFGIMPTIIGEGDSIVLIGRKELQWVVAGRIIERQFAVMSDVWLSQTCFK